MKIKTLVAVLLLSGGVTSTFAQSDCNANSSISHEAVRAKNFKDAYAPCMEVLKDCPTLRYYTYTDAQKILVGLMSQIKDRNSAEYKKLFDELMAVHDQKMKYIPEFATKMKGVPSVASALGTKAVDYLQYSPAPDLNQAYAWLKESAETAKGESDGAVLHYFVDVSMQKVKADTNHTDQFFQDYINASQYADDAIAAEDNAKKKAVLQTIKDNLVAMFVNSGVADCESLQNIYGPKVEENKSDSAFLKKTITILKMMKCNESEAYFKASDYLYRVNPSADAAVGVAYMYYKKGDYDTAVKYFDEALGMETDNAKKAEMAYATAAALWQAKKLSQARSYAQKAISFNESYGEPYILLAQMYGSNPNWSDEPALNRCTYFVVIDKLQRAKAVDPSVTDKVNELISTPVTVSRSAVGSVSLQPSDKHMSLQPHVVGHKNMSITIALGVMVMLLLFSSCSGRKKEMGAAITERDSLPVMDTKGVTTLISDSGITRYRVNTAEWLIYDRKNPPYWAFEKGIYLEKFDSVFHTEASIKADTAYYYNKKELWKLMGNVHIQNLKGEKFDTELLYWDQNKKRVYSDRRVRIEQPDQIIYAIGFESNEQLTKYRFFKTEGIFYVDEESTTPSDTLRTDSIK